MGALVQMEGHPKRWRCQAQRPLTAGVEEAPSLAPTMAPAFDECSGILIPSKRHMQHIWLVSVWVP